MLVFLFYLFIGIIVLLTVASIILILSSVKIQIKKLEANNTKIKYDIVINLFFLSKVKYFKIKINEDFINKRININKIMKFFKPKEDIKSQYNEIKFDFEMLHIKLEEFHMELSVGTEDVLITTVLIVVISTIFSILFKKAIKKYDSKKYFYNITPVYTNKNILKLTLSSIINIKIVHIIYVIILLIKGSGLNNERTSNRKFNDDCYE
ncbi:MAG: hypothetical protein FWF46_07175 [Oscillospiraceae bacterium]|nr:hypothetical protein [Oscillospiraceae bacterium]